MGVIDILRRLASIAGLSVFRPRAMLGSGDKALELASSMRGGQIAPQPITRSRWYLADVDAAEGAANQGQLEPVGQLANLIRRDGFASGKLSARTSGLVRLPRVFRGRRDICQALEGTQTTEGTDGARSVFEMLAPSAELALLAADGILVGVGVGELVRVAGRAYPKLVRHSPEHLVYHWHENQWYFRSWAGLVAITPGQGRWVLHIPGGTQAPWQNGDWRALARAVIRKDHANNYRDNYVATLANGARVVTAPAGATDDQVSGFLGQVAQWGVNTVFGLRPGYDVKVVEAQGRGVEVFDETIDDANEEIAIILAGQTVTTDGGTGFANADIFRSITGDLVTATGDALAFTVNTQILPAFVVSVFGEDALEEGASMSWNTTPPKDRVQESSALVSTISAIKTAATALSQYGRVLDVDAMASRFGLPLMPRGTALPALPPLPTAPEARAEGASARRLLRVMS